ncbi:DNA cytosine methyltransferase [Eshraghiella crossota]
MKKYTFIDLFAGCGGLSEGFYKQGYKSLLHLEIDGAACKTLRTRMKHYGYSDEEIEDAVLCADITSDGIIKEIDKRLHEDVDIIIGGPPCQAFSTVGRAQSPDSMNSDPRNYLFENYLQILNHIKPKMFIFENVKGILSAKPKGVKIFDIIVREMSKTYNIVSDPKTILLNAADYGVPQIRERVIIIGVRKDIDFIDVKDIYASIPKSHSDTDTSLPNYVTVGEAILDLPKLNPGEGENEQRVKPLKRKNDYLKKIANNSGIIYNHSARNHNDADKERYRILSENKNWQLKDLQVVRPDLVHHDPKHFGNRYTVQESDKPGKTVVAHLYKDGNLFIHPDPEQARTFTVREAARIQSFPDDFVFEGSRTDQFKQVGNAVPPLMAETFARTLGEFLELIDEKSKGKE